MLLGRLRSYCLVLSHSFTTCTLSEGSESEERSYTSMLTPSFPSLPSLTAVASSPVATFIASLLRGAIVVLGCVIGEGWRRKQRPGWIGSPILKSLSEAVRGIVSPWGEDEEIDEFTATSEAALG